MVGFADLVAAVQVGTRKTPVSRATELPLEGAERTALCELGALGLMRRAGATGSAATPLPRAPDEPLRIADVADPLSEAIERSLPIVLEWATEAARRGFVAPHAVLPELVSLASRYPEIVPVLGSRGRWLANQIGADLGSGEKALPEGEFDSLDWADRVVVIERSLEDLPLLTKALKDKRKEVREAAVERLMRLPHSPQAQALRALAQAAVVVRRSILHRELQVTPPDPASLPKWLPRSPTDPQRGPGAHALYDLIRHVPPTAWDRPPRELLDLASKTDYDAVLADGWGEATLRFDAQAWSDTLLTYGKRIARQGYAQRASDAAFDAALVEAMGSGNSGSNLAYGLLRGRQRPFSPQVSRIVIGAAQAGWGYGSLFTDLAVQLHLSVLPLLDAPWTGPDEAARLRAEGAREGLRTLLQLRARLLESLR